MTCSCFQKHDTGLQPYSLAWKILWCAVAIHSKNPPYKCTKSSLEGSSKSNLHTRIVVFSQSPFTVSGFEIQRRAYVKTDSHLIMMKKRPGEVGFSVSRTVCRTKFYRTREINRGSIQRIELQTAADKRCKLRRPIRVLHEIGVRIPITRNAREECKRDGAFFHPGAPLNYCACVDWIFIAEIQLRAKYLETLALPKIGEANQITPLPIRYKAIVLSDMARPRMTRPYALVHPSRQLFDFDHSIFRLEFQSHSQWSR